MNNIKKDMLVELCDGNYATSYGFVNGANGIFKASTTYCEKTIIWIMFQNFKIETLTRIYIYIVCCVLVLKVDVIYSEPSLVIVLKEYKCMCMSYIIYIYIICVYKVHSCSIFTLLNNFQNIIQQSPEHCLIIIMGDFNVDILKDNNQPKNKQELLYFIDKFQLKSQFSESTTKVGLQLDHIWANIIGNECKFGVTKAY
jgi:hypothetical protein